MNRGRGREGGNGGRLDTETLTDVVEMYLQGKIVMKMQLGALFYGLMECFYL